MKNIQNISPGLLALLMLALLALNGCDGCKPPVCEQTCNFGGIVNDTCGCDCPPGATGPNCETVNSPIEVRLDSITVVSFPNMKYDQGSGTNPVPWDSGSSTSAPDLLVEVLRESAFLGSTQPYLANAQLNVSHVLRFADPLLAPFWSQYTITLYDQDPGSAREIMGRATFGFTDYAGPFPHARTIRLETGHPDAVGPAILDVHLEWLF